MIRKIKKSWLPKEIYVDRSAMLLHPYCEMSRTIQRKMIRLYQSEFPGPSEIPIHKIVRMDVYAMFLNGKFAAMMVFYGPMLLYLIVDHTQRKKGCGSIAVQTAITRTKTLGYSKMFLECKPDLMGYYRKFGGYEFKPGERKMYDGIGYAKLTIDL